MALQEMFPAVANSPATELSAAITDIQTTITLLDASKLPDAPNIATIGVDESAETVRYEGKSGNELTGVTRGFSGTAAKAWGVGVGVARYFTAYDADALRENVAGHSVQLADTATMLTGFVNISQFPRLLGETTDNERFNRAIQAMDRGIILIPDTIEYEFKGPIRINKAFVNLMALGKPKLKNTGFTDLIMIETDDLEVIPFFTYLTGLDLEGNIFSGHAVKVAYAYNVDIDKMYIHDHGLDGLFSLHGMNSTVTKCRFDRNRHAFNLTAVDNGHRSTTWTLQDVYCGTHREVAGILSGGDSNTLINVKYEGNTGGGLYITNDEVNPLLINNYFEFNTGYSLNIDSGNSGSMNGGRFADENVSAHINLGDTTGWVINSTWHSTNSIGGTGVNITKGYSGGNDIIIGCQLFGETPIGGNAGNVSVIDAKGIIDRFKISTGDDIRITGQGKGLIINDDNGLHNYRIHAIDGVLTLTEI